MPPRLELLKHCWSSVELPILPFLAPRVFEPWPPSRHGRLRSAARNVRYQSVVANRGYDEYPECGREGLERSILKGKEDVVFPFGDPEDAAKRESRNPFEVRKISKPRMQNTPEEWQSSARSFLKAEAVERNPQPVKSQRVEEVEMSDYPLGTLEDAGSDRIDSPIRDLLRSTMDIVVSPQTQKRLTWRQLVDAPELLSWRSVMDAVERVHPGMTPMYRGRGNQHSGSHDLRRWKYEFAPDFHQLKSSGSIKDFWQRVCNDAGEDGKGRMLIKIWNPLMGLALLHEPENALDFLEAMRIDGLSPWKISNVIHCVVISQLHSSDSSSLAMDLMSRIVDLIPKYPGLQLSPTTVYRLLSSVPNSALKDFYKSLNIHQKSITNASLFQFASRFAKNGDTDLAFEILQMVQKTGVDFNTPTILSLCTSIIRHAQDDPQTQHQTADIFKFVHESGMIPNIITYNVLILSTIASGDPETAWKIHDMMVEIGIETDKFTYSILLNDAKFRRDEAAIEVVRNLVRQRGIISDYIATDELHLIHLLAVDENGYSTGHENSFGSAFDRMFKYYSEFFEIEPLRRFIPHLPASDAEVFGERMTPGPAVLNVMIAGFLRVCHSYHLRQFYQNIRNMALGGDSAVEELLKDPYLYNLILMAYGRHQDLWGEAPSIVADMVSGDDQPTTDNPSLNTRDANVSPKPYTLPTPNAYTWSILLGIFMKHGLPQAAEKVLAMMTRRGVAPTAVTWNQLIKGHALLQDENMVVSALSRLGDAGFRPDQRTFHHLHAIRDRARFENELLKRNLIVKTDFMEQLQKDVVADVVKNRRRMY